MNAGHRNRSRSQRTDPPAPGAVAPAPGAPSSAAVRPASPEASRPDGRTPRTVRADSRTPEGWRAASAEIPPFRSVGFAVSSIGYATARRFRETLAPLQLEPREFAILRAVDAAQGISQQAAAERLQIPPSRMVAFVDLLEQRGLLERKPRPDDRRSWALHLSAAGHGVLRRAFELASGLERELCADLGEREREELLDMLWRIGARLGLAPGTHAAHRHAGLLADGEGDGAGDDEGPCAEG